MAVKSIKSNGELKYKTIFSKVLGKFYQGISENEDKTFCLSHHIGVDIYSEAGDLVKSLITGNGLFDVCSAAGFIYVVAQEDTKLHIYKQSGELVKSMPVAASERAGIAYWEGDLYVSNYAGNSINKLAGVNTSNVNTSVILKDAVSTPRYIAVNADVIVVSCYQAHQVQGFSKASLQPLFTYGDVYGSGPNQVKCPWGVCIDFYGNILIADSDNKRLHVLDHNGKLLNHIKTNDVATALCLDSNMHLHVCGSTRSRIYCKICYYFE